MRWSITHISRLLKERHSISDAVTFVLTALDGYLLRLSFCQAEQVWFMGYRYMYLTSMLSSEPFTVSRHLVALDRCWTVNVVLFKGNIYTYIHTYTTLIALVDQLCQWLAPVKTFVSICLHANLEKTGSPETTLYSCSTFPRDRRQSKHNFRLVDHDDGVHDCIIVFAFCVEVLVWSFLEKAANQNATICFVLLFVF